MRIFLIDFWSKDLGHVDVALALKEKSHQIVYWVYTKECAEIEFARFPGTIFHDIADALSGKPPAEVDTREFPPVGRDFISEFYETELEVMTMMNKKYERWPVDERKHFYYRLLRYWNGVIQKYRPEVIIFFTIPHTVYDFVLYALAKKYNIQTLMFEETAVNDRLLLLSDYKICPPALQGESLDRQPTLFSFSDLSLDLQGYYNYHQQKSRDLKYSGSTRVYMQDWKKAYSGFNLFLKKLEVILSSLKDRTFFRKVYLFFKNRLGPNIKKEYRSVQSKVDWSRKFIYVPLGYQPERTTCPHGGIFTDQILMIEMLSAALPDDWLIYVKEHPVQWLPRGLEFFSYRYRGYYQTIARIPKVKVIPIATDTYELINKSRAAAAVTGTAAWEAALRLKPALVFGSVWFQDSPGIFKVRDFFSCHKALRQIVGGYRVPEDKLVNYLAVFGKSSFHGYLQSFGRRISELTKEQNVLNITNALLQEIEK